MNALVAESTPARLVVVDRNTKVKPSIVDLLNDWQYLERSIHRLLCAWGRDMKEWEDKSTLHRHVWEQSQVVQRLRTRIAEFPGGKPDAPVSVTLEKLVNTVLLAPSFDDALFGIYVLLSKTLVQSYSHYSAVAHPIHDAPTVSIIHEICGIKEQQWRWYRNYRRRNELEPQVEYQAAVESALAECGYFASALPAHDNPAAPVGARTDFIPRRVSNRRGYENQKYDLMPYLQVDMPHNCEARRLLWAIAYMMEKNLPDDQLLWLYWGHAMPWDFQYDISRHLWDESRHGDSGLARLQDFGISLEEIGFRFYTPLEENIDPATGELDARPGKPMNPHDLYEALFFVGMIAESGHFEVKNEAYADFKEGEDMESAEMMLFDIIDETAHVQYAHKWLPVLAEKAGISNAGYRERAVQVRKEYQVKALASRESFANLPRTLDNPNYTFYQELLRRSRAVKPLVMVPESNPRSPMPM